MQKKFITNLLLLLLLNLLIKPIWLLGIDRGVQNIVGAEAYGYYFALLNFSFLFNILLDFGITNFNNRNIAQNQHLLNKHFSSIVILKLLLALVYFIVTMGVAISLHYNRQQLLMVGILGFNQFLLSFILYLRSNISGMLMFKTDSILSVLDRLLMILFCGVLLWGNITKTPFRIEWFVFSQTAAYLITLLVAALIVGTRASFKKLHWNKAFFLMIIKKSFPFAVLVLLMTFYNRIDTVMIERLLDGRVGYEQAGIYASAFRLLDASNMIAYLFSVILIPLFARMIKLKQPVDRLVKTAFTMLMVMAVLVAVIAAFYSFEIMGLLYPIHADESNAMFQARINQSAEIFRYLMTGFIGISTTYVFGSLLTAGGKITQLNILAASGMALNILLNFILIPSMYANGAAITSLITQLFTAMVQVALVQSLFKFRINYAYLLRLAGYACLVIALGFISSRIDAAWIIKIVIISIFSLLSAVILRLFNIRSLVQVLRGYE